MKIVFSRKGFDSGAGGVPSPVIGGRPTSIPIPAHDRSEATYGDLGLGEIVERITGGRFAATSLCHDDPMFERCRCAFGQTGAAQGHLATAESALATYSCSSAFSPVQTAATRTTASSATSRLQK